MQEIEFKLMDVEEGFARVAIPVSYGHKVIGCVYRAKSGSGRTSTSWFTRSSWYGEQGSADTRDAAARRLIAKHLERQVRS